jgi:hypothetical protein
LGGAAAFTSARFVTTSSAKTTVGCVGGCGFACAMQRGRKAANAADKRQDLAQAYLIPFLAW